MADIAVTTATSPARIPLFGRLALEAKIVDLPQLQECLSIQYQQDADGQTPEPLGKLMIAKGFATVAQVDELLRLQQARTTSTRPAKAVLEQRFPAGQVILAQGDDGEHDLLIMMEGAVEVSIDGQVRERFDKKGTFLGTISAVLGTPQLATVTAAAPCRMMRILAADLVDTLRRRPPIALGLAESLAERLAGALAATQLPGKMTAPTLPVPQFPAEEAGSTAVDDDEGILNLNHLAALVADDDEVLRLDGIRAPAATFVNGEPVGESRVLRDEDIVQVDRYVVQVLLNYPHRMEVSSGPDDPDATALDETAAASEPAAPPPPSPTTATPSDDLVDGAAPDAVTIPAQIHALKANPLSAEAVEAIETRLNLHSELSRIDRIRSRIDPSEDIADDLTKELSRQRREMRRIPATESLKRSLDKLSRRLNPGDEDRPALPPEMVQAFELGIRQKKILLDRHDSTLPTLRACAAAAVDEPLYGILYRLGIVADALFGWAVYALSLSEMAAGGQNRLAEIRALLNGEDPLNASPDDEAALANETKAIEARLAAIKWELSVIEREMVNEFWTVYEAAALALVNGVQPVDEPFVRAFLRRGLLGCSGRFIPPHIAKDILTQCAEPLRKVDFGVGTTHVLYADESIALAAEGVIPNAHDEDLELKQPNTPRWKADRSWRREINYRIQKALYADVLAELQAAAATARSEQAALEKRLAMLKVKSPDDQVKRKELRDSLQEWKVEAARKQRLVEMMEGTIMHRLEEKADAVRRMREGTEEISLADRVHQEVAFVRQYCRLVAQLAEPFLPLALGRTFRPETDAVNQRDTLAAAVAEIEKQDPLIFSDPLVPGTKKAHRVLVRTGPIMVILPAGGGMAMAVTPRCDGENGSFVVPGHFSRTGIRQQALWDAMADYRYDTSKAACGVDAMTSDTLVATYAEFRWSMRKKSRDIRQKAGIYTEENDRTNWRRHYQMYLKSAADNGKQLFFKSPDLYQAIIGKFIELPEGGEVLRRR